MTASGRGCVKTLAEHSGRKIHPSDHSVLAWQHLGKGKATPENRIVSCFHTASVGSGRLGEPPAAMFSRVRPGLCRQAQDYATSDLSLIHS